MLMRRSCIFDLVAGGEAPLVRRGTRLAVFTSAATEAESDVRRGLSTGSGKVEWDAIADARVGAARARGERSASSETQSSIRGPGDVRRPSARPGSRRLLVVDPVAGARPGRAARALYWL